MSKSWKTICGIYLRAADLPPGGRQYRITTVNEEVLRPGERARLVAHLTGGVRLTLNATNCRALEEQSGTDDPDGWAGLIVHLACDPSVTDPYGKVVGGVRVRRAPTTPAADTPPPTRPPALTRPAVAKPPAGKPVPFKPAAEQRRPAPLPNPPSEEVILIEQDLDD